VDHINHIRHDNRWSNLRIADQSENQRNRSMNKSNSSGFTGVCWCKKLDKWKSFITLNKKNKHLGYFENKDDAVEARKAANIKYDYHKDHGGKNMGYR